VCEVFRQLFFCCNFWVKEQGRCGKTAGYSPADFSKVLFMETAKAFPGESFIMVCMKSTFATQEYYDGLIEKASKIKNLQFIEHVTAGGDAMNELYKYAKIFYNTSVFEGLPTTFIQAGKNMTPIISLNINPEQFLDIYKCGFFCENKLEYLYSNVEKLLNNKDLIKEMSINSLRYVEENHNLKKNIKKLINLINS
jgi:glycosyltransferase involved in cell wall biosynthesis